jgi:hypothetical protein
LRQRPLLLDPAVPLAPIPLVAPLPGMLDDVASAGRPDALLELAAPVSAGLALLLGPMPLVPPAGCSWRGRGHRALRCLVRRRSIVAATADRQCERNARSYGQFLGHLVHPRDVKIMVREWCSTPLFLQRKARTSPVPRARERL